MRNAIRNVLAVLLVTSSVIALQAQAGHRGHDRWNRHNDYQRHNYGGHGNYWGYNGHHYPGGRYYRSHGRHHGNEAAYLVGGLVVGSLLTNAYYNSYERRVVQQPVYREVVYSSSPIVRSTHVIRQNQGRRLFRDRNGDCFERSTSAAGEELLVELDRSACAW